jgi:parallel beta-helix repeat protein
MKRWSWLCLLSLGAIAHAATISVPATQPTIQAGINAAKNGDTVLVSPGTYFENINFLGKAITVKSSGGAKVTIIDGGHLDPVVVFNTGESSGSVLHGFTIQNGSAGSSSFSDGGGISINSASPTVTANIITNNTAADGGGGILLRSSSALVQGNTISNNSRDYRRGLGSDHRERDSEQHLGIGRRRRNQHVRCGHTYTEEQHHPRKRGEWSLSVFARRRHLDCE